MMVAGMRYVGSGTYQLCYDLFCIFIAVVGVGGLVLMLDAAVIYLSCTVHIIKQQELLVI